ncbi:TetR/AcrR family transcriptional regulator [Viridibacillus sp. NPDC093762]|uniref:TetR/AcrR family transcriptional regulator n=1 Tax=Viridibacillus sp. NPDC093762 TaxID=3390720 RepID=UPI003D0956BE
MNKRENKQLRGVITRDKILATALGLFNERGYNKVTVDEIILASGTSKGSFYQHFPSKASIFLYQFSKADEYHTKISKDIPSNLLELTKLEHFSLEVLDFLDKEMGKEMGKVIYSSAIGSNEHTYFINANRPLFKIIRTYIEKAFSNNEIKNGYSLDEVYTSLIQGILGIIYYWAINDNITSLKQVGQPLLSAIIIGFKTHYNEITSKEENLSY